MPHPGEELFKEAQSMLGGAMHGWEYIAIFEKLQHAGNAGHPAAYYELGNHLEWFNKGPDTLAQVFECCLKSAEMGHRPAQKRVARMLRRGLGTDLDLASAMYWEEQSQLRRRH